MSELIEKNVDVVQLNKVSVVEENLIGRYVVVQYDGLPFPGVILDVDEDEIEVKVQNSHLPKCTKMCSC
jgi:transcription antitermination factor NusG